MRLLAIDPMSDWREIVEWDWAQCNSGNVLHAVATVDNDADKDWFAVGATECGRSGHLYIPGLLTRMSAKRCDRCCDLTGMPRGAQSPKNVAECRPIAEARIGALRAASHDTKTAVEWEAMRCLLRINPLSVWAA